MRWVWLFCILQTTSKIHIRVIHKKERNFKCTECTFSATQNDYLIIHISSVHTLKGKVKCDICEYSTFRKVDIKRHMAANHEAIKKFKCEECEYFSFIITSRTCLVFDIDFPSTLTTLHSNGLSGWTAFMCRTRCHFEGNLTSQCAFFTKKILYSMMHFGIHFHSND